MNISPEEFRRRCSEGQQRRFRRRGNERSRDRILAMLVDRELTVKEISGRVGIIDCVAYRHLRILEKEGRVVRTVPDPRGLKPAHLFTAATPKEVGTAAPLEAPLPAFALTREELAQERASSFERQRARTNDLRGRQPVVRGAWA